MLLRFTSCALNGPPLGIQDQSQKSSVVSVLISVTTDMSPTGDLLVTVSHQFLLGKCLPELVWGPSCVALAWH